MDARWIRARVWERSVRPAHRVDCGSGERRIDARVRADRRRYVPVQSSSNISRLNSPHVSFTGREPASVVAVFMCTSWARKPDPSSRLLEKPFVDKALWTASVVKGCHSQHN